MSRPYPDTSTYDAAGICWLGVELISYTDVQTMDGPSRSENWATLGSPEAAELIRQAITFATAIGAAVQRVAAAVLPIVETVEAYVARPDVQARIQSVGILLKEAHRRVEAVDAPGYTPYFQKMGQSGLSARLQAGMVQHFGRRLHAESQERRAALIAFHNLARRRRWDPYLARQVALLCDHSRDADLLDGAFRDAGCPELKGEFVVLLQGARGGAHSGARG